MLSNVLVNAHIYIPVMVGVTFLMEFLSLKYFMKILPKDHGREFAVNGALSQGRTDCGRVEVGKKADLVLIDLHTLHNLPVYDPYATLTYSADREDVLMTMVDGRILYENGEYTSIDEERLKYEFQNTVTHYFD